MILINKGKIIQKQQSKEEEVEYSIYNNFEDIKIYWENLLPCSDQKNNIFLSYTFAKIFWQFWKRKNDALNIILLKHQGKVVSILPLIKTSVNFFGFKIDKLSFIGNGFSDFLNFIILDGYHDIACKGIKRYFSENCYNWISLRAIVDFKITNQVLLTLKKYFVEKKKDKVINRFIKIIDKENVRKNLPRKLVKNIRNEKNRAHKLGNLDFKICTEFETLDQYLDHLFRLHIKKHNISSRFKEIKYRVWFSTFTKEFFKSDSLVLSSLILNDKIISVLCSFKNSESVMTYTTASDPEYNSISPEVLHFYFLFDRFFKNIETFDFLSSGKTETFSHWTKNYRDIYQVNLYSRDFKGLLVYAYVIFNKLKSNIILYFKSFPLICDSYICLVLSKMGLNKERK